VLSSKLTTPRKLQPDGFADIAVVSLEKTVRQCLADGDHKKIRTIIDQLCHDYAYAVHQPHARNGGLIGLAAASIALGSVGLRLSTSRPLIELAHRMSQDISTESYHRY